MKSILQDRYGSVYPVLILVLSLCAASLMILLLGDLLSPFFSTVFSIDLGVSQDAAAPRGFTEAFFRIIWPKGILAFLFIVLSAATLMSYQKKNYSNYGGGSF